MKYLENSNLETLGEILSTSEDNLDGRLEARIESYRYFTIILTLIKQQSLVQFSQNAKWFL